MVYQMPLVDGQTYHVYNRGLDRRPTFTSKRHYARFQQLLWYYQHGVLPASLSRFQEMGPDQQQSILVARAESVPIVAVLAYCLMPNHFHILLRQLTDGGISLYLSLLQNSHTRYFNTGAQRAGSLFLNHFKYVRVETETQLLHTSRYIHLNPYTSFITKTHDQLRAYPWSSLPAYLRNQESFVDRSVILQAFSDSRGYEEFILNQADYQRSLKQGEHLLLDHNDSLR